MIQHHGEPEHPITDTSLLEREEYGDFPAKALPTQTFTFNLKYNRIRTGFLLTIFFQLRYIWPVVKAYGFRCCTGSFGEHVLASPHHSHRLVMMQFAIGVWWKFGSKQLMQPSSGTLLKFSVTKRNLLHGGDKASSLKVVGAGVVSQIDKIKRMFV